MIDIDRLLEAMIKVNASDLHLKVGSPPMYRINGDLRPVDHPRLAPKDTEDVMLALAPARRREMFETHGTADFAYALPSTGRFRINIFHQRGSISLAIRHVKIDIPSFEELNLPQAIRTIVEVPRGLVLVTGVTGSGKSTTLAAMIEQINTERTAHIMTIEDPIEFLIRDRRSIVNQREIGVDTHSFSNALRAALRQDPDVILVGEMRDFETIETALTAAETGHLVMSTLHTLDATETINRIISVFPPYQQKQVRMQLATILKAVISQRLVPRADGNGRVPALEVLVSTAFVRECIGDKDRTKEIPEVISKGFTTYGMQTFDQSLMQLVKDGLVTYDEALKNVSNPDDFALRFRGIASTSDSQWNEFDGEGGGEEEKEKPESDNIDDALADDDGFSIDRF
ncbi:MAG: type IV pilus twitching motility protein PilT [Acidobacteria bacterium]|nr:type IV pilus twitching motility protein PilT [Acidobacteriota bacterium]